MDFCGVDQGWSILKEPVPYLSVCGHLNASHNLGQLTFNVLDRFLKKVTWAVLLNTPNLFSQLWQDKGTCRLGALTCFFPVIPLYVSSLHLSILAQSRDHSRAFSSSVETINPSVFSRTSIICLSVIKTLLTGKCRIKVPGSRSGPWKGLPWQRTRANVRLTWWGLKGWHRAQGNERIIV